MRKHNLPYWELNPITKSVTLATWKPGSIFFSYSPEGSRQTETFILERKEGMKYFQALNYRNAVRKSKNI